MERYIVLFILIVNPLHLYKSYNIDFNSPIIKSIQSENKSSFGFSLLIFSSKKNNNKYLLVGSPTDQAFQSPIHTSGTFYSCPLTKDYTDCTQRSLSDKSENSLFGYVLDSDPTDDAIYTCAPRFLKSMTNVKYVEGNCWELNDEYKEMGTIPNVDCELSIRKNKEDYEFRNCLTGGAVKSLGNKQLLLTAPYSYEGRGLLINSRFDSGSNAMVSNYLQVHSYMSKYQLTGFSLSVGRIFRQNGVRTAVLGAPGLPQSNLTAFKLGFGQVVLVKLIGSALSFDGVLFGESFGSAFGYAVLAIDLNGDGFDELVIGAPYTSNNRGKVFVYWNQEKIETNERGYSFTLSVHTPLVLQSSKKDDNGQFGNCLENIGDINKDTYLDFAVGSPFENDGRGSVYIYLGSKDTRITLSQKIEASKIDPDFRGFGFSLYGRSQDLDANDYPDLVVGAPVSGHTIGLRSRPLMRVYAEKMLASADHLISYDLKTLPTCSFEGNMIGCIEMTISIFYHYPKLPNCPPNEQPKIVNVTLDLDRLFLNSSYSKRVYFEDRSNVKRKSMSIVCKQPTVHLNSNSEKFKILFTDIVFFNISLPIDISLKWSMTDTEVPRRDYKAVEPLAPLSQYPVMDRSHFELTNRILFGLGCTPESCQPILTLQAELSLIKTDDEYMLYIGSSSSFTLTINIRNIATTTDNRAYNTFLKVGYLSGGIIPSSITPGQYRFTATGLTYAVTSPLETKTVENVKLVFSLTNDFIQNAEKYIYLNLSLEAMSPQTHLKPITMKIRVRMVADINLKVSLTQIDAISFKKVPILGISAVTDEKKIGPRLKMKISLSNLEQASVVVSSKLIIYFPWEVAGNPSHPHGQYLLYLQNMPKFFISGGERNITCDTQSLATLVNPINTKMFETRKDNNQIHDVSVANVSMPVKAPSQHRLRKDLLLISTSDGSVLKSAWEHKVFLDCMNGSARCIPIICDMGPLSRSSGEINIELNFRLWIHTFVENFLKYKFVQTEIPIIWVPEAEYDIVLKNPDGAYKSFPDYMQQMAVVKADNLQKPKAPPSLDVIWAVVIAVVVGVVLLATIVVILYKCNFFRRKNVLKNQKRRRLSKQS